MARKFIQLVVDGAYLLGLADDGTIWILKDYTIGWQPYSAPTVPQPEPVVYDDLVAVMRVKTPRVT